MDSPQEPQAPRPVPPPSDLGLGSLIARVESFAARVARALGFGRE